MSQFCYRYIAQGGETALEENEKDLKQFERKLEQLDAKKKSVQSQVDGLKNDTSKQQVCEQPNSNFYAFCEMCHSVLAVFTRLQFTLLCLSVYIVLFMQIICKQKLKVLNGTSWPCQVMDLQKNFGGNLYFKTET